MATQAARTRDEYTVGWVCALPKEQTAATAMLDQKHADLPKPPNDSNTYTLGSIGKHNIVIACLPKGQIGTSSAAAVATRMIDAFPSIKIGLMVGIGGGIPPKVRLGDVVVSTPIGPFPGVVQWDFGKAKEGGSFERTGSLNNPPTSLLTALTKLETEHELNGSKIPDYLNDLKEKWPRLVPKYLRSNSLKDILFRPDYGHVGESPDYEVTLGVADGDDDEESCQFCDETRIVKRKPRDMRVHYGLIASGNQVIKDAMFRDKLNKDLGGGVLCVEMEAAGLMNNFPCIVIRGICDYADSHKNKDWQEHAAIMAAAFAKELLSYVPTGELEATSRAIDIIKSISEEIKEDVDGLRATVHNIDQKTVLDRLPVAVGASFDSHTEANNPTCLPDTRIELLDQIKEWARSLHTESIFWLNGMAGTGKSTVSRTLAKLYASTHRLGATFFFKRGETDRGSSAKLFTTIAAQLAISNPDVAPYIKDAIDANPTITDKGLREQFDKLIFRPLSEVSPNAIRAKTIIIVIDALDECESEDEVKLVISLFARAKSLGLKIFATSRPELPIRLGFSEIKGQYQDVILHEIPNPTIKHDLSVFLKHELAMIRRNYNCSVQEHRQLDADWPGQSNIDILITMAIPLFIFAATMCRFLADRKCGNPYERLRVILEYQIKSQTSKLGATYLPILDQQITGLDTREQDKVLRQFRHIVGSIVLLASPLPTHALAKLLNISRDIIDTRLDMLHSVLSIPLTAESPVRLFHLSFRDFLVDPENQKQNPFWINEAQTHVQLAASCLRCMKEFLREDICGLRQLGLEGSIVDSETVSSCIPAQVQYACLHWAFHLQSAGEHGDYEEAFQFMKQYILYWVEALSLMRQLRQVIMIITNLQAVLREENNKAFSDFLADSLRLFQANLSTVSTAPLQIYSSALIFAPQSSIVRNSFNSLIPSWIHLKPKAESSWDQCIQKLEGHSGGVYSVAFSHDSSLIASGSGDETIRLWRADTGECVQTLQGHSHTVSSVAFSHDSSLIASGSYDETIRLWRADTGECVQTLQGHSRVVSSVAFSHDSSLIASGSDDKTIRLWRADTGECVQTLQGHSHTVYSVAFSHDSSLIASGSDDKTIRLWRADTGECVQTLQGHSHTVYSVAFSHDSSLIASGSGDKTIRLWRADTGECVQTLQGHSRTVYSVAFSHDSSLIASGSYDETIRLWRADTGECVQTLQGHSRVVSSVAFSHDSSLIASGSYDNTIRLWRADTGECVQTLQGHSHTVYSVAFSHDSSLIASGSGDKTIRLWRADTGECVQTLQGHSRAVYSVAFSHDSSLIASGSYDKTIRLWRADTGECVQTLQGHSHTVYSVAFSHDSSLIASGSGDETIRLWRADTGECVQTLQGHSHTVSSVAFSHDSSLIASGSDDDTIRLWRADTGDCVQELAIDSKAHLSFKANSDCLKLITNQGAFTTVGTDYNFRTTGYGFSRDRCWITWNENNLLRLPVEYRPNCNAVNEYAVNRSSVAIGCESGRVIVMVFLDYI